MTDKPKGKKPGQQGINSNWRLGLPSASAGRTARLCLGLSDICPSRETMLRVTPT